VRKLAIVPFFGGTSSATHSKIETRLDYLAKTLESLREIGFDPLVYQAKSDKVAVEGSKRLNIEPIWLPWATCTDVKAFLSHDCLVLVTEADHVWHVSDEAVWEIPNKSQYLAPWRLDLVGPQGEMENPGSPTYKVNGKEYAIANGAHHLVDSDDPFGIIPVHGNQSAFSGAFVATSEFFKLIKFRKRHLLPVEHATGFDANATGLCVKTVSVNRCWIDHLSPRDRYQSPES